VISCAKYAVIGPDGGLSSLVRSAVKRPVFDGQGIGVIYEHLLPCVFAFHI
jgi:hypothetical protein